MANLHGFDSTTVDPSVGFPLIPVGEYVAEITESGENRNKENTGSYIALTWTICDGASAKQKIFVNLNLDNPSAQAVAMARAELSAICRAVGVAKPNDTNELHLRRCRIKVEHKTGKDGQTRAVIKKYEPLVAPSTPPVAGAATTNVNIPPWARKAV